MVPVEVAPAGDPLVEDALPKIAVITGASRPGSVNKSVAQWVLAQVAGRADADFELVDIANFNLPLLDEAYPAAYQNYQTGLRRRAPHRGSTRCGGRAGALGDDRRQAGAAGVLS
jgi:hypothetical protein